MKEAFKKALNDFSRNGFIYVFELREEINDSFNLEVDATAQEMLALGIKIGYHLKAENNETQA